MRTVIIEYFILLNRMQLIEKAKYLPVIGSRQSRQICHVKIWPNQSSYLPMIFPSLEVIVINLSNTNNKTSVVISTSIQIGAFNLYVAFFSSLNIIIFI